MSWVWVWLDLIVYKYIHRVKPLNPFCWKIKKRSKQEGISKSLIVVQLYNRLLPGIQTAQAEDYNKIESSPCTYPDFIDFN